jgi:hypothetical protein
MIDMYCRHNHGVDERCEGCRELYEYAHQRALKCPFDEEKPVCGKCQIHCYKPEMKEKIREVMKYSGPKMISSHPILAIRHLISSRKGVPMVGKKR